MFSILLGCLRAQRGPAQQFRLEHAYEKKTEHACCVFGDPRVSVSLVSWPPLGIRHAKFEHARVRPRVSKPRCSQDSLKLGLRPKQFGGWKQRRRRQCRQRNIGGVIVGCSTRHIRYVCPTLPAATLPTAMLPLLMPVFLLFRARSSPTPPALLSCFLACSRCMLLCNFEAPARARNF